MRNSPFANSPTNRAPIPGAKKDAGFLATQEPHEYINQALYDTTLDYVWGSSAEVKTFGTADFYTDSNGDPKDINDATFTIENGSKILVLLENTKISATKLNAGGKEIIVGTLNQSAIPMGSYDLHFNGPDDIVRADLKTSGTGEFIFDCKLIQALLETDNMTVREPAPNIFLNGVPSAGTPMNYTTAFLVEPGLSIPGTVPDSMTRLTSNDIAISDGGLDTLSAYRFDGSWSLLGSSLSITGLSQSSVAALNSTDVALYDSNDDTLRTYRFNGSTWSQVGNSLTVGVSFGLAISALNGTDVAATHGNNNSLSTYRFDGTDWSLLGSTLTGLSWSSPFPTTLNETDIAVAEEASTGSIRTYRFNGSTWSQVGSSLLGTGTAIGEPAALNGTDIAFFDGAANDNLTVYRFNGVTWSQVGPNTHISGAGVNAMTSLNGVDIAFLDNSLDTLFTYRFGFDLDGGPYTP